MLERRDNKVSSQRYALTEVKVVTTEGRGVFRRIKILFPRWSEEWGVTVPIRKFPRKVRSAFDNDELVVVEITPEARNISELNPKNFRVFTV